LLELNLIAVKKLVKRMSYRDHLRYIMSR